MRPDISIILPIYNVEMYIERCIDSIMAQSYQNFELIVVDDCGTDNSIKLAKEKLGNSSLNYIIIQNDSNQGISETRNIGIANCNSKYILFVDSDDWLNPFNLEKLYSAASSQNADLVSCKALHFWEKSGLFTEMHRIKKGIYTPDNYLSLLFQGHTSSHLWVRLIKKEILKDIIFPKNIIFEDEIIFPYIVQKSNKIVQLDDTLYYYLQRNSNTSITGTKPINIEEFILNLRKLKLDFEFSYDSNGLTFRKFVYKVLFIITYNTIHYSKSYREAQLNLKFIQSYMNFKSIISDLFTLSKSAKVNFLLYLLILKINGMVIYISHKKVLTRLQRIRPTKQIFK